MIRNRITAAGIILLLALWIMTGAFTGACYAKNPEKAATAVYISPEGERLTASFDIPAKKVIVERPGKKTRILPLAVSASGARYSDGKMTFWEHQGTATLFRGDTIVFHGKEDPAASANPAAKKKHKRQRTQE